MAIIGVCIITLFTAIVINFFESRGKKVRKEKKNIVETGTMTLFFLVFYFVIRFGIGAVDFGDVFFRTGLLVVGTLGIVLGTFVNIKGRLVLGGNWANQIKIYKKHTLVSAWPYSLVRHPLYASLIWIFYFSSLIYLNWLAFLLNSFVFVPMMYYRAREEERLLGEGFKKYSNYKRRVGMFFPKF